MQRIRGDEAHVASSIALLSLAALCQGDLSGAAQLAAEALGVASRHGFSVIVTWCAHVAVRVAADLTAPTDLARLLGALDVLDTNASLHISPLQRRQYAELVAQTRAQAGENAFAEKWAEGRAMHVAQFIQSLLDVLQS